MNLSPSTRLSAFRNRAGAPQVLQHGTVLERPMALLHLDAYVPGVTTSFHGQYTGLLTVVCDLTGFVVVVPFVKATASSFARLFCAEVLFKHGICSRVVIDDDSKFKGLFKDMCAALQLDYIVLAKGNHQGCRCERYHRFQNKVLKIECTKRRSNQIFVEAAAAAAYAWNSMPIDGTDIVRSYVVCGRIFRFPIEVALDALPEPTDDQALSVQRYLTAVDSEHALSCEILALLVDERRTVHRERINAGRRPKHFAVDDKVAVQIQVQSDADQGRVGKLVYDYKGPFVAIEACGHDSYNVRKLDDPAGAIKHVKGSSLVPLPALLQPCSPIDTIDYRFLNQDRAPVPNPLKECLGIDSYNYLWLHGSEPPAPLSNDPAPVTPAVIDATNPAAPTVSRTFLSERNPFNAEPFT
jgi:hypothetical protein